MPLSYIGVAIPARLERAASSFAEKRSDPLSYGIVVDLSRIGRDASCLRCKCCPAERKARGRGGGSRTLRLVFGL